MTEVCALHSCKFSSFPLKNEIMCLLKVISNIFVSFVENLHELNDTIMPWIFNASNPLSLDISVTTVKQLQSLKGKK